MKKISTIFSFIALSYCSLTMATVNVEPTNKELSQYILSLPDDKKPIAEYIVKNNPNYSCFNHSNIKNLLAMNSVENAVLEDRKNINTEDSNNYICGLISKTVFVENNSTVSIKVYGQSFSEHDDIIIPRIIDSNNQEIIPTSILIKSSLGERVAMPSNTRMNARALDKGEWILTLNYDTEKFKSLSAIHWDTEKSIPIIDDNDFSLKVVRNGEILSLKNRENITRDVVAKKDKKVNDIKVFRKLTTAIPYMLETVIEINSYKDENIVNLGKINPKDFYLLDVSRSVKINEINGEYFATLNLGHNSIVIQAVSNKKVSDFNSPLVLGVSSEFWSINTVGKVFDIKGLQGTNAKIAQTPESWVNIPTYVRTGNFEIVEKENKLEENDLYISTKLSRKTWIDSKGKGFSLNKLEIKNNPSNLQFISQSPEQSNISILSLHLNENPQVILEENNLAIIPLKNENNLTYSFETTQNNFISNILPSNIWKTNEEIISWRVNLSPRTRLITTTNDLFSGSWVDEWDLYSVFFLILLIIAYWKIINYKMALLVGFSILLFVSLTTLIWTWWIMFLLLVLAKRVLVYMKNKNIDEVKERKINKKMLILSGFFSIFLIMGSYQTYELIISEVQYIINPSLEFRKYNNYLHDNRFADPNAPTIQTVPMMAKSEPLPASSLMLEIITPIAKLGSQPIKEETIKSYQVGRPSPIWTTVSYQKQIDLKSNLSSMSNTEISFYISPVWLVNVMAIIQIFTAIFLVGLGWLVNYVLLTRNKNVENSKFYKFFFKE